MSTISITKLYSLLSDKVGKDNAENLTSFIEEKIKCEISEKTENLATKKDLADTKIDLIKWNFAFWITIVIMFASLYFKK